MSRGMTRQRDELHAIEDWLGATKRVPLTGLDIRPCDGLRTLEERLRILRRLSDDFRRQPKVTFCLLDLDFRFSSSIAVPTLLSNEPKLMMVPPSSTSSARSSIAFPPRASKATSSLCPRRASRTCSFQLLSLVE
jgi:hypothetical protein